MSKFLAHLEMAAATAGAVALSLMMMLMATGMSNPFKEKEKKKEAATRMSYGLSRGILDNIGAETPYTYPKSAIYGNTGTNTAVPSRQDLDKFEQYENVMDDLNGVPFRALGLAVCALGRTIPETQEELRRQVLLLAYNLATAPRLVNPSQVWDAVVQYSVEAESAIEWREAIACLNALVLVLCASDRPDGGDAIDDDVYRLYVPSYIQVATSGGGGYKTVTFAPSALVHPDASPAEVNSAYNWADEVEPLGRDGQDVQDGALGRAAAMPWLSRTTGLDSVPARTAVARASQFRPVDQASRARSYSSASPIVRFSIRDPGLPPVVTQVPRERVRKKVVRVYTLHICQALMGKPEEREEALSRIANERIGRQLSQVVDNVEAALTKDKESKLLGTMHKPFSLWVHRVVCYAVQYADLLSRLRSQQRNLGRSDLMSALIVSLAMMEGASQNPKATEALEILSQRMSEEAGDEGYISLDEAFIKLRRISARGQQEGISCNVEHIGYRPTRPRAWRRMRRYWHGSLQAFQITGRCSRCWMQEGIYRSNMRVSWSKLSSWYHLRGTSSSGLFVRCSACMVVLV